MFKINDLIHIHKPSGNIYKIYDVKTYWIPKDNNGENLSEEPADTSNYNTSIILHYHHYSNSTGKVLNVNDPTYCGVRFAHLFDKQKCLDMHQKKIDKIRNQATLSPEDEKEITKIEGYMEQVKKNLW